MVDGVEEGADDLVVAGGDAAEVLEAADGGFDPPTLAVAAPVVADRDGSVAAAGMTGMAPASRKLARNRSAS